MSPDRLRAMDRQVYCRSMLQYKYAVLSTCCASSLERYVVISSSHRPHTSLHVLPLILNFILFYVIVSDTKAMDALGSPTPQEGKRFRNMPYSSSNETLRSYTSFGVKLSETGKRGCPPRGSSGWQMGVVPCTCVHALIAPVSVIYIRASV